MDCLLGQVSARVCRLPPYARTVADRRHMDAGPALAAVDRCLTAGVTIR